jgi:hypothetical protein
MAETDRQTSPLPPVRPEDGRFYSSVVSYALTLEGIARRLHATRSRGWDRIGIVISGLIVIILAWINHAQHQMPTIAIGGLSIGLHIPLVILWLAWIGWYLSRIGRIRRSIVRQQRCFTCGASTLSTPTERDGVGTCAHCDKPFNRGWYAPPR